MRQPSARRGLHRRPTARPARRPTNVTVSGTPDSPRALSSSPGRTNGLRSRTPPVPAPPSPPPAPLDGRWPPRPPYRVIRTSPAPGAVGGSAGPPRRRAPPALAPTPARPRSPTHDSSSSTADSHESDLRLCNPCSGHPALAAPHGPASPPRGSGAFLGGPGRGALAAGDLEVDGNVEVGGCGVGVCGFREVDDDQANPGVGGAFDHDGLADVAR